MTNPPNHSPRDDVNSSEFRAMNQVTKTHEANDDEINLWELIGHLKSGWRWVVGGGLVGLACAAGFLTLTASKYEASAIIQPATIVIDSKAATVEPVALTVERLNFATFYDEALVNACQAESATALAESVQAAVVRGDSLISISYRAKTVDAAQLCVSNIINKLTKIQADAAKPLLHQMESQLAVTKQRIEELEQFLVQHEKPLAATTNAAVFVMLKQGELTELREMYNSQQIQLTEPLTRPMQLLAPIYSPENAVSPKKLITVVLGSMVGLFAGLLALFINRSWRSYSSMQS